MTETPSITKNFYVSNTYTGDDVGAALRVAGLAGAGASLASPERARRNVLVAHADINNKEEVWTMRIVKVFIVDPNENLPLESRILHRGEEKLTDLTDQELFFEINIQPLLAKHNEGRVTTLDKKASTAMGKPVHLEAVRIRDLKMNVVEVAKF